MQISPRRASRGAVPSVLVAIVVTVVWTVPLAHATMPGANGIVAAVKGGDVVYFDPSTGLVTPLLTTVFYQQDPAWSPTGEWLALGISGRISVARADGSEVDKFELAGTAGAFDMSISWHPDGEHFIYLTSRGQLKSISRSGTDQATVAYGVSGASYAPDGQHIVVSRADLEVIDADGANPTTLLTLEGAQRAPDWSPDGSKIAFQSRGPDGWDIWVVNADGTSPALLTPDAANDTDPTWAPDGSAILFRSERGNGGLFTVAPTGGAATELPSSDKLETPAWQPEVVGLRASETMIDPGDAVNLDVVLAYPLDNPQVTLQRRPFGGEWRNIQRLTVADDGTADVELTNVKATTDFRARWMGDATHPPATSLVTTVSVRAIARGRLIHRDGTEGRYALYRGNHLVAYLARIIPNHSGSRVCFRMQRRRGAWHEIAFDCFRLRRDSTITVFTGPFPAGMRLRIHIEFEDKDHVRATSGWAYFRYLH